MRSRTLALGCLLVSLLVLSSCAWPGSSTTAQHRPSPTATSWPPLPISTNLAVSPTATSSVCDSATQWKPPADNIQLNDIAMVSPDEGWAVGYTAPSEGV